jgi:hypothetical protein
MREKINVLERGDDMVLAEHFTPIAGGRLAAVTVETVRFTRPERVDFRLVRGPVPQVVESFVLTERSSGSRLTYEGQMGTDTCGGSGSGGAPRWPGAGKPRSLTLWRRSRPKPSVGPRAERAAP